MPLTTRIPPGDAPAIALPITTRVGTPLAHLSKLHSDLSDIARLVGRQHEKATHGHLPEVSSLVVMPFAIGCQVDMPQA
jgi:hypothetical protein